LTALFFSASKGDMISAGESVEDSAELVEGGYLAALGVYHDLHCLVSIRDSFPLPALEAHDSRGN